MMDPDSQFNLTQKAGMQSGAADAAAESSRLAGRNAAQAGGAPAAALAAQTSQFGNQAQAGAQGAYNKYLSGAMQQGAGMASGATNNLAQMNQTQMNAFSNQRLANSQIDSQATGFGAQMLGKGLGAVFNPTGAVMGAAKSAYGKWKEGQQEGGYIGMQDGGKVHADYRSQLEGSDAEWESKISDGLYTSEGDYTREGLLSKYGFSDEAVVDTAYGGNSPNQAVGMNISEGGRRTKLDLSRGRRWDSDKELSESRIKSKWATADRAEGRGYTPGEGYHPDSYAGYQSDQYKAESAKETEDFFGPDGFQNGGLVDMYQSGGYAESPYGNRGGMLSQIMGPDGIPMNIKTRIGGQTVGQ